MYNTCGMSSHEEFLGAFNIGSGNSVNHEWFHEHDTQRTGSFFHGMTGQRAQCAVLAAVEVSIHVGLTQRNVVELWQLDRHNTRAA